jgi:glycosyltransferase involved in cell wall biosynthesis
MDERASGYLTDVGASLRILHVIADLGTYGAQRMLGLLLNGFDEPDQTTAVMTIYSSPSAAASLQVPLLDVARHGRYDFAFFPRMIAQMRRWHPDVVHTHMHNGKYWGRLAALACGVPTIVHTEHNSEFGAPSPFRPLNRLLVPRTDAVIAFSRAHRDALCADEGIPPDRVTVIPNGIALAPPDPAARTRARAELGAGDEPLIVHVGRLAAVKNQRLAIEALALLPRPARLVLVGEGPDGAALTAFARERGVVERVTLLGFRDDAAALVAAADVALITSLNEAMPLAAIEAMAAGAPLVSVPWHGAREMLGDGAFGTLIADYSAPALAAAIAAVLADPAAARTRAAAAQTFARDEYTIETTARRYAELYRTLSDDKRSARAAITAARS